MRSMQQPDSLRTASSYIASGDTRDREAERHALLSLPVYATGDSWPVKEVRKSDKADKEKRGFERTGFVAV